MGKQTSYQDCNRSGDMQQGGRRRDLEAGTFQDFAELFGSQRSTGGIWHKREPLEKPPRNRITQADDRVRRVVERHQKDTSRFQGAKQFAERGVDMRCVFKVV